MPNTFTPMEGWGLFLFLVTPSDFATNLNNQITAPGATIASVNAYFLSSLAGSPYNLASKIDITQFAPLWTNSSFGLASELNQDPIDLLRALTPPLPYTDPPCPKPTDQTSLWTQLHK